MTKKADRNKIYFLWLCDLVGISQSDPGPLELASMLYRKPYYGVFPNDDNRAEDGKKLREIWWSENKWAKKEEILNGPCTVLEMLIGLSKRMDYELGDTRYPERLHKWFHLFINNLQLAIPEANDPKLAQKAEDNNSILDNWMQRRFMYNGSGGLFPLKKPREDQRRVEIWYQLMAYLDENYEI